ncbi:MAG: tRNA pseudouridine(13) synthase TruD [Gammaproteobacteria bacterium]|nr:tRNA pseudouridine(13) synthase TruD [Gammaproteobacteria bacterium]
MNSETQYDANAWAYAYGAPTATAIIRHTADDFIVEETLGFEPEGVGEHLFVKLRKRDANTEWVAKQLQQFAQLEASDVGFAGLKDRHALTTQTFSLNFSGRELPDWSAFSCEGVEIVSLKRHPRKLKRGTLRGNRFTLTLRELSESPQQLEPRLRQLQAGGVPNYFGPQRFGRHFANLERAAKLFSGELRVKDRHLRGLFLSAARAWIFNELLSMRLAQPDWQRLQLGDLPIYEGSSRPLIALQADDPRLLSPPADLHPSGPMWGAGELASAAAVAAAEAAVAARYPLFCSGLAAAGLKQERRLLLIPLQSLTWKWLAETVLQLSFDLPAGSYATAVLRELIQTTPAAALPVDEF